MNISKFCLISLAAAMTIAPPRVHARAEVAVARPTAALDLARQLNQAFVQVAEDVSPAVVVITVTQKPSANPHADDGSDDSDDPFEQFRRYFQRQRQPQSQERSVGQGSGIIISADGYILTNRHVVEDAEKIEVRLKDGRTYSAKVRGVDAPADVAVIKIDAKGLTVAKLADSDKTRVGEFAIAIGAPFALDYSVTFGHVSAKDRSNIFSDESGSGMQDQNFIQTDANINPGNSGGPLVNIDGEVIGINTLIRGLHTGIGFAIPINLAKQVADQLISDGKYHRSWLGISIRSLKEDDKFREWMDGLQDGVIVEEIIPDGPAAKSRLRAADVITAVDGKKVTTSQQLKDEIRVKKIGQDVTLDVYRKPYEGGKPVKIIVKPGEFVEPTDVAAEEPQAPDSSGSHNALGVAVRALTPELAKRFNLDLSHLTELKVGVVVTFVDQSGLAAQSGIEQGDIITSIDDHPTTTVRQFREAVRNVNTQKGAMVHLIIDGSEKFEILKEGAE
jgi:serine protease Do